MSPHSPPRDHHVALMTNRRLMCATIQSDLKGITLSEKNVNPPKVTYCLIQCINDKVMEMENRFVVAGDYGGGGAGAWL